MTNVTVTCTPGPYMNQMADSELSAQSNARTKGEFVMTLSPEEMRLCFPAKFKKTFKEDLKRGIDQLLDRQLLMNELGVASLDETLLQRVWDKGIWELVDVLYDEIEQGDKDSKVCMNAILDCFPQVANSIGYDGHGKAPKEDREEFAADFITHIHGCIAHAYREAAEPKEEEVV